MVYVVLFAVSLFEKQCPTCLDKCLWVDARYTDIPTRETIHFYLLFFFFEY